MKVRLILTNTRAYIKIMSVYTRGTCMLYVGLFRGQKLIAELYRYLHHQSAKMSLTLLANCNMCN